MQNSNSSELKKLQELQAMLQTIQTKQQLSIPMTMREMNLMADLERMQQMKPKERVHEDGGNLVFERTVEVDGIFEGVQGRMEAEAHNTGEGVVGARYVGSIDEVTAAVWAKECGAKMYSKEWMAHAKKKRDSGEFAKYFPQQLRKRLI